MDDSENICPLCCEELDLSDREFYPCKCGYQVCMWCWHRIRETESGLCPACRTPYGEDPHQFSAVDVADVLRANKEREAALKRQKQEQQNSTVLLSASSSHQANHPMQQPLSAAGTGGGGGGSHDDAAAMEVPKDRTQLGNMRVIRRNLVYAVGLPTNIAGEDMLRKSDYFGQYGKISKIVINRAVAGDGGGRRSSASAYVTFAHKEDTLACILALDGFYLDGRNIRASYGTSKYCSAFIKNVRCNNPECTYLHEMGAAEDTFTKQEIQAGYVTSGRDVLARQQQILAEQLRQGAGNVTVPRKRVGGGGPSGTGRAATNHVFPPPEYDEPSKPAPTLVPQPAGVTRASTGGNFSLNPANISAKLGRSSSVGGGRSPPTGPAPPIPTAAPLSLRSKSAASVVAGMHSTKGEEAASPHTTLTPLVPLKRASKPMKPAAPVITTSSEEPKLPSMRVGKTKSNGIRNGAFAAAGARRDTPLGPSSIGGDVISVRNVGNIQATLLPGAAQSKNADGGLSSLLGGEVFTGQLPNKPIGRGIGGSNANNGDKWNSNQIGLRPAGSDLWNGANGGPANSSSALASILGVNLPTGSGSLREASWQQNNPQPSSKPSPLAALNNSSSLSSGRIGGLPVAGGNVIGGVPIGASAPTGVAAPPPIPAPKSGGGFVGANGGHSDIALLQSLLPGVHITSGSDNGGWNRGFGPGTLGGDTLPGWGGSSRGAPVGAIGQGNGHAPGPGQIW